MAVGLCISSVNAADTYTSYHLDSKLWSELQTLSTRSEGYGVQTTLSLVYLHTSQYIIISQDKKHVYQTTMSDISRHVSNSTSNDSASVAATSIFWATHTHRKVDLRRQHAFSGVARVKSAPRRALYGWGWYISLTESIRIQRIELGNF